MLVFVVKVCICIALVIICTILGIKKSKKYEIREYILNDFITTFKSLKNDIEYMLISLPDAIEKIRHTLRAEVKDVLGAISVHMLDESDINSMNKRVMNEINNIYELTYYDKEIIYQGFSSLGKADVDSQISIIQNTVQRLSRQLGEANEEKNKNFKLYRTLGTAIGLMIAIVFI